MLKFIVDWFKKPAQNAHAPAVPEVAAPYKVETPVVPVAEPKPVVQAAQCGCGRSPTGFCIGLHKLTAEEWSVHPENTTKPVAKKTVVKKSAAKPAAMTAIKKPRQPKAK